MNTLLYDMSQYNEIADWKTVANQTNALLLKSSQNSWKDPTFDNKVLNCRKYNIPFGLWHFYQPDVAPKSQVNKFLEIYNSLGDKHPVFLDCEDIAYLGSDGKAVIVRPNSAIQYTEWIGEWLDLVEKSTGQIPGIYTRESYWKSWIIQSRDWSRYPLWVANYQVSSPVLPPGWKEWVIWQYGSQKLDGVSSGAVDADVFNGSREDLLKFFYSPDSVNIPTVGNDTFHCTVGALRVRAKPGLDGEIVGSLGYGKTLEVTGAQKEVNGITWVEAKVWVALKSSDMKYGNIT